MKTTFSKKTAVILFNLGGPDSLDAVKPFLFNLFNDKAIISLPNPFRFFLAKLISSKRNKTACEIYENIGGKSPLLELTNSQAHELEKELSYLGDFKTFVAMRYWKPFSKEIMPKILDYNPDEIILLPLYPQFSSTTSQSSIDDFKKNLNKYEHNINVKTICCYPIEQDFIKSHALLMKKAIISHYNDDIKKFRFLFSAHGLPQKVIDKGDPYASQAQKTTEEIVKKFADLLNVKAQDIDYILCFQSKVGPMKWTTPSLDFELKRAAIDKKNTVIIPVSFVSEHSETLVELDIEYKEKAEQLGIKKYIRVPALNSEGHFIKSLVDICKNVAANDNSEIFSGSKPKRICAKDFKLCKNQNYES